MWTKNPWEKKEKKRKEMLIIIFNKINNIKVPELETYHGGVHLEAQGDE